MRKFAVLSAALLAAVAVGRLVSAEAPAIGDAAPDFAAKTVDGKDISLKGTLKDSDAVVVCFTCNKCPVAVAYEDRFIDFTKQYKGKKVTFVALNCNNASEDLEKMKQRAEEKGFNFIYAFDETGNAAAEFGATRTPELFVVDGEGAIQYHGSFDDNMNKPKKAYLVNAVDAVLAGKKPEVAETKAFGCGINRKKN